MEDAKKFFFLSGKALPLLLVAMPLKKNNFFCGTPFRNVLESMQRLFNLPKKIKTN